MPNSYSDIVRRTSVPVDPLGTVPVQETVFGSVPITILSDNRRVRRPSQFIFVPGDAQYTASGIEQGSTGEIMDRSLKAPVKQMEELEGTNSHNSVITIVKAIVILILGVAVAMAVSPFSPLPHNESIGAVLDIGLPILGGLLLFYALFHDRHV